MSPGTFCEVDVFGSALGADSERGGEGGCVAIGGCESGEGATAGTEAVCLVSEGSILVVEMLV